MAGNLAYCWNHLSVIMSPRSGGSPTQRAGFVLSILCKNQAGRWVIFRDANLLTEGAKPTAA